MPPLRVLNAKTKRFKSNDQTFIMESYYDSQMLGLKSQSETDVELVLQDGMIPCHSVVLQGVSPFFDEIFNTQGQFFPAPRHVLMPEFSVQIMMKVVQLIYHEEVVVGTKMEAEQVEETLKLLKICSSQKLTLDSSVKSKDHRQVAYLMTNNTFRVAEPLSTPSSSLEKLSTSKKTEPSSSSLNKLKLRQRPQEKKMIIDSDVENDDDSDAAIDNSSSSPSIDNSSSSDDDESNRYQPTKNKRRMTRAKLVNGKADRINHCLTALQKLGNTEVEAVKGASSSKDGVNGVNNNKSKKTVPSSASSSTSSKINRGSINTPAKIISKVVPPANASVMASSPSSDDDDPPDVSSGEEISLKKFQAQAKKCQECRKKYDNAAEASNCLNVHKRVRCYFCFEVYKNTEDLFTHFSEKHKKAGRDKFLMCPYCDSSIPFKSVSCHVISTHLTSDQKPKVEPPATTTGVIRSSASVSGRPGRPSYSTTTPASSSGPPSKKCKSSPAQSTDSTTSNGELRVTGLECNIRQKSGRNNGKVWIFKLTKKREGRAPS